VTSPSHQHTIIIIIVVALYNDAPVPVHRGPLLQRQSQHRLFCVHSKNNHERPLLFHDDSQRSSQTHRVRDQRPPEAEYQYSECLNAVQQDLYTRVAHNCLLKSAILANAA